MRDAESFPITCFENEMKGRLSGALVIEGRHHRKRVPHPTGTVEKPRNCHCEESGWKREGRAMTTKQSARLHLESVNRDCLVVLHALHHLLALLAMTRSRLFRQPRQGGFPSGRSLMQQTPTLAGRSPVCHRGDVTTSTSNSRCPARPPASAGSSPMSSRK